MSVAIAEPHSISQSPTAADASIRVILGDLTARGQIAGLSLSIGLIVRRG
jgi:hypothetical protein